MDKQQEFAVIAMEKFMSRKRLPRNVYRAMQQNFKRKKFKLGDAGWPPKIYWTGSEAKGNQYWRKHPQPYNRCKRVGGC